MFTEVGKNAVWALVRSSSGELAFTFFLTICITGGMILTSFYTIFKLKISDFLQLEPGLTDCVTFCSFVGLFSKMITVSCFNFMVMAGEIQLMIAHGKDYPY